MCSDFFFSSPHFFSRHPPGHSKKRRNYKKKKTFVTFWFVSSCLFFFCFFLKRTNKKKIYEKNGWNWDVFFPETRASLEQDLEHAWNAFRLPCSHLLFSFFLFFNFSRVVSSTTSGKKTDYSEDGSSNNNNTHTHTHTQKNPKIFFFPFFFMFFFSVSTLPESSNGFWLAVIQLLRGGFYSFASIFFSFSAFVSFEAPLFFLVENIYLETSREREKENVCVETSRLWLAVEMNLTTW